MAGSEIAPAVPSPTSSVRSEHDDLERRIEERIRFVGQRIGWVELSWRLLIWLVGGMGFLLAFTACDQWLFSRGMPDTLRWTAWLVLAGLSAAWLGLAVGPYLLHRIHPLFAAYVMEKAVPGLKHAVMAFLLLRERRQDFEHDPLAKHVFLGLEQKAVTVETVPLDAVVDRSQVVRWAAILAGVIAVFCLYVVLSPKNALVSTARVLIPWADIAPATRVRIEAVSPGNAEVTAGERVVVTVTVFGLRSGEEPQLRFSTADGQFLDQVIPLQPADGDASRFSAELSPAIQHDTTYRIEAADAETREFRIRVVPAIRLELRSVELEYPPYTRLEKKTLVGMGDISALEGTRVTVLAQGSVPLTQAEIDLDDGRMRVPMQQSGDVWQGRFSLKMSNKEPNVEEFTAYTLRGTDQDGRMIREPVRFSIATIPDRPPWADYQDPPADGSVIPVNAVVTLQVKAQDPDFGLRRLTLYVEKDGRSIHSSVLFELPPSMPGSTETVSKSFDLRPAELKLEPGDGIFCWLEALDNREPTANRAESRRLQLVIGESAPSDTAESQQPKPEAGDAAENNPDQAASQPSDAASDTSGKGQGERADDSPMPNQEEESAATDAAQDGTQGQKTGETSSEAGASQSSQGDNGRPDESMPSEKSADSQEGRKGVGGEGTQGDSQSPDASTGSSSGDGSDSQAQGGIAGDRDTDAQPSGASRPSAGSRDGPGDDASSQAVNDRGQRPSQSEAGDADGQGNSAGMQEVGDGRGAGTVQGDGAGEGSPADGGGQEGATSDFSSPSNAGRPGKSEDDANLSGKQPGDSGEGSEEAATPADGANNPGEAFERILNYLREKSGAGTQARDHSPGAASRRDSLDASPNKTTGGADRSEAGEPSSASTGGTDSVREPQASANKPSGRGTDGGFTPSGVDSSKPTEGQTSGSGTQTPGGPREKPTDSSGPAGDTQPGATPQDAAMGSTPPSGAEFQGDSTQNGQPAETPPQVSRAAETEGFSERSAEPQASTDPSSRDSSQTQSENSGTLPGGGREGQGQSSPQAGYGVPGSQAPATDGGEAMRDPTGPESGDPNGAGSPAADAGGPRPGQAGPTGEPAVGRPGQERSTGQSSPGSGNPRGGGLPGEGEPAPPQNVPRPDSADEPVVEFARRQTDLALRYLEDELAKNTPDPELLQRLGWTRADMERFAQRWRELREKAETPTADTASVQQFREVLKSLGLRPQGTELRSGRGVKDSQRGLGTPRQTAPPPQWSEQYREYLKALGKSD